MDDRRDELERQAAQAIATLRSQLRERYGWTHLQVRASLERGPARLRVSGTIAVPRLRALVRERLEPLAAARSLVLELDLQTLAAARWHAIPTAGLELWAEHPSRATRSLATELAVADGPIAALALDGDAALVRARDGTVGWTAAALGSIVPARPLPEPRLPAAPGPAICAAAFAYLGVPYVLGANSAQRIDCSALVQRAYEAAFGLLVPRNSNDQLALADGGEPLAQVAAEAGDLLFIRSRSTGRTHVAIASERGTIIHASRSRGAVIEEPAAELELDAHWLRRVAWPRVVEWARQQAGRAHLEVG